MLAVVYKGTTQTDWTAHNGTKEFVKLNPDNNEIWYTASSKLSETTSTSSSGLHTNALNTTITSHTFENGQGVITFTDDVTSIGNYAFQGCSSLTSITIPSSVTSISNYAFQGCSSLTSITIPSSVTSISNYAFQGCSSLTSITVEATTPHTLSSTTAIPDNVSAIYVPSASVDAYKTATNWSSFASKIQAIG